jgi:tRNA-splicing ligase RtcB
MWMMDRSDAAWRAHVSDDSPGVKRIAKHGVMETDALLVTDDAHWDTHSDDRSPGQLVNTAAMPGIVGEAWAMADWHFGYGFPIGGVVATDVEWGEEGGAISPGGVGFDINCGVRLCSTGLDRNSINIQSLTRRLVGSIPAGATSKGGYQISADNLEEILSGGAAAAADLGIGAHEDLAVIESNGVMESDERNVGERAKKRGSKALGTLGSGNHFLELQIVDQVVDEVAANAFGLHVGAVTAMIHTGSRGLGHQVCSEHVEAIESRYRKQDGGWYSEDWDFSLPDRQLAAAPIHSRLGADYLDAMRAAGNYAFANRSALTQRLREVLKRESGGNGEVEVVYDVCHNIAKVEEHTVNGSSCTCCVHRKGATRALGGDHPELASKFSSTGQPVLVPGDMGTASWVLAGPRHGANRAFSSSCHGAGRALSRKAARDSIDSNELINELRQNGVHVHARTPNALAEEAPAAYKDVDEVVRLSDMAGLARPVARLTPFLVIKG